MGIYGIALEQRSQLRYSEDEQLVEGGKAGCRNWRGHSTGQEVLWGTLSEWSPGSFQNWLLWGHVGCVTRELFFKNNRESEFYMKPLPFKIRLTTEPRFSNILPKICVCGRRRQVGLRPVTSAQRTELSTQALGSSCSSLFSQCAFLSLPVWGVTTHRFQSSGAYRLWALNSAFLLRSNQLNTGNSDLCGWVSLGSIRFPQLNLSSTDVKSAWHKTCAQGPKQNVTSWSRINNRVALYTPDDFHGTVIWRELKSENPREMHKENPSPLTPQTRLKTSKTSLKLCSKWKAVTREKHGLISFCFQHWKEPTWGGKVPLGKSLTGLTTRCIFLLTFILTKSAHLKPGKPRKVRRLHLGAL